jgi:hypothetical protein
MGLNGELTIVKFDKGAGSGGSASSSLERRRTVVADGFPSFSGAFGAFGLGGLARQNGKLFFVVGLTPQEVGDPTTACVGQADVDSCVALFSAFLQQTGVLGRVNSLTSSAGWQKVASVGQFDFDFAANNRFLSPGNPEWNPGDADPFGLTPGPSGSFYVVDAASNTLDSVSSTGAINVLKFIPDPVTHTPIFDAAPTCAALAPNGDVYIATESNTLFRWDGHALTTVLAGGPIGQAVGCVADRDGNVYVANLSSEIRGSFPDFNEKPFDGSIVKVTPQLETSFVATGLNFPTGLALGPDGALYVSLNGLCPKDLSLLNSQNSPPGACPEPGKVVRIEPN